MKFVCVICDKEHSIPTNGFPRNKPLLNLLNCRASQIYRGEYVKWFGEELDLILEKRTKILNKIDNRINYVREHFEDIRYKIWCISINNNQGRRAGQHKSRR
jgi:hypothetical protein